MKRLMMYLKDYKKESILAPLFKLLEAFFELLVPLVMANIIDYGISNRNMGYIGKMGLLLLLLGVVGLASSITAQFFAAKAAVGFSTKLRQALFDHIEDLSFTDIDKAGTSTMITRMTSDVNQVQSGINMTLRLFLRSPIIVFGAMIMAFTIDVKCALIFVVAIPLLSVVVFGIILSTIPMYKKVQSRLDQVLGITRENLTGVRVIRAFHQEAKEADRFRENNEALSVMQIFVGKISACMNPVTYIIVNGAIIALIYTGAVQVNIGNLSQGEVVAIINYMNQILVELVKLANLIVTMTKALACAERVASVFDIGADAVYVGVQDQKLADKVDKSAPFLDFKHVSLTYQGAGAPTLQDMNFTVNRGDTVGIIGGTGSGKTYLVKPEKPLSAEDIHRLENGLDIGDEKPTAPSKARLTENGDLLLTIHEGRFHQVKRMLQAVDNQVLTLERVSFGPLSLDLSLQRGEYWALTEEEIEVLSAAGKKS